MVSDLFKLKHQKAILKSVGFEMIGGSSFVIGIASTYYLLTTQAEIEEKKAKNIASIVGIACYTFGSCLSAYLQRQSYKEAIAKSTEVAAFIGASISSQSLFEYLGWSSVTVIWASQAVGLLCYALAAFGFNKGMKHWKNRDLETVEATKQTSDQLVGMLAFSIATSIMNTFKMPLYATYLLGLSMFALATWVKIALTYEPGEQESERTRLIF